jgi:hypothetical protein
MCISGTLMFNGQAKRMGTPARSAELQSLSPEEASSLAVLYLPPLTRLLELSSDLDKLLQDCRQFDRAAWKRTVVRARCVLKIESERLGLVDSSVQTFLRCRGGQRKLVIEANRKMREKAAEAHNLDAARKRVGAQMAMLALNRCVTFGIDMSPFNLTDGEKAAVTNYFENSMNQAEPGRSEQLQSTCNSWAVIASDALVAALTRALSEPEPDVIAVRSELESVSYEFLLRIARLSAELDRRLRHERKTKESQSRKNVYRIRVALVLESERVELVGQAIAGVLRCFGGQRRLLMESASRQYESPVNGIKDPRVRKIVERICEKTAVKRGQPDEHREMQQDLSHPGPPNSRSIPFTRSLVR